MGQWVLRPGCGPLCISVEGDRTWGFGFEGGGRQNSVWVAAPCGTRSLGCGENTLCLLCWVDERGGREAGRRRVCSGGHDDGQRKWTEMGRRAGQCLAPDRLDEGDGALAQGMGSVVTAYLALTLEFEHGWRGMDHDWCTGLLCGGRWCMVLEAVTWIPAWGDQSQQPCRARSGGRCP